MSDLPADLTFSNPRKLVEIDDYPSGGNRVKCRFEVEKGKKGERAVRTTTNKHDVWCKPKKATYALKVVFADGSDGRTYVLEYTQYGSIHIARHDFMSVAYLHEKDPRREEIKNIILSVESK